MCLQLILEDCEGDQMEVGSVSTTGEQREYIS